eukprot:m.107608 g.107608  ORF g.107608 m.107608 type:complete len:416 (+) comp27811_c2_seq1:300-1547(+)
MGLVAFFMLAIAVTANFGFGFGTEVDVRGASAQWTRVFLTDAASKGAVCLDGSPGAYYIRTANAAGVAADPKKWVIFMEGGGWCASDSNCLSRSLTNLGSSKAYPAIPGGMEGTGLFETFSTATVVYAKYCDGGSWTGALTTKPVKVGNQTIYYRGRGMLDGLFDSLIETQGMNKAEELLWTGCSAGGLTTYIHADWVAQQMKERVPSATVVALADAMFSLNTLDFQGSSQWPEFMQFVYFAMNSTASVNQACVMYMAETYGVPKGNTSEGWRCMFGSAVGKFVQTPLFVLNSKYDTWQAKRIIGANCSISQCDPALQTFWVKYGQEMVRLLDELPARHGVYVHNCQSHCQTGTGPWSTDSVNGTIMQQAVTSWYAAALQGTQATLPRHIDRCDVLPCGEDVCDGKPPPHSISLF